MKTYQTPLLKFKEQQGVTAIVVAIAIVMLLGFAALAVDVGYMMTTKNELQNIADSAALAATGYLGKIYAGLTQSQMDTYNCSTAGDCASIIAQAQDVVGAGKNIAGAQDISIDTADVTIGKWDGDSLTLTPTTGYPNPLPDAVRVIARRDSGGNGPIMTVFANIFGIDTASVNAYATADLSGMSEIVKGGLPIPVGISRFKFESEYCNTPIKFYPTNDIYACGGWHVFEDDKTKIKQDILDGELDGSWESPPGEVGDTYYFKGGTDNAAYEKLKELFDSKKGINDYWEDEDNGVVNEWPVDGDLDSNTWTTNVVVYDSDDCSNPVTFLDVSGFTTIKIYEICTATSDPSVQIPYDPLYSDPPPEASCVSGEKQIVAIIMCDFTKPSRGGGGEYGIMGSIPGLVQPGPED